VTIRFSPVERRTVADEVREAIADRIRSGVLSPGEPLPSERDLCEQFGVARTTVREAVQGLIMLGVVEKRGNRTCVTEHLRDVNFDGDGRKGRVRELFEVRQIVEIPIARLTAKRATAADRDEILTLARQFRTDMPLTQFRELDRAFHWAIARACGNDTLYELYGKVLESLFHSGDFDAILGSGKNRRAVREVIRGAVDAHRAIAAAVAIGDADSVAAAAEQHLDQVENHMIARMI
jgi:GntR family transcriptional repressor for pyruvate dehydrogenase complex